MSDEQIQDPFAIGQKLRVARSNSGLSLRELAAEAEVSASLLSQIENGRTMPSVRSLHSIADALSVPITYFFPEDDEGETPEREEEEEKAVPTDEEPPRKVELTPSEFRSNEERDGFGARMFGEADYPAIRGPVVKADRRAVIELEGGVLWSRLTPGPEPGLEFLLIEYEVGASSGTKMSHHIGREFTYVLEGKLLLELGFEKYLLEQGDSVIFDSTTPHRLSNAGDVPMHAVTMIFDQ